MIDYVLSRGGLRKMFLRKELVSCPGRTSSAPSFCLQWPAKHRGWEAWHLRVSRESVLNTRPLPAAQAREKQGLGGKERRSQNLTLPFAVTVR